MNEIVANTLLGDVTLCPGDRFITIDARGRIIAFTYIAVHNGIGSREIYMHNDTDDHYCNVSKTWFAFRSINIIS